MVETERSLDDILPVPNDVTVCRDYQGHVRPMPTPLTAPQAANLGIDYDVSSASVRSIAVEQAATRLTARLAVEVARGYRTDTDVPETCLVAHQPPRSG
jgi:hypothetical protein